MDEDIELFGGIIIGIFIMFFLAVICFHDSISEEQIIKHNCAEYDSKTGDFKWIR